jgi:hypothetical protein
MMETGELLVVYRECDEDRSSEAAMGERGGGAKRTFLRVNEPKKTGARSAPARTRGQNPLVVNTLLCGATGKVSDCEGAVYKYMSLFYHVSCCASKA